MYIPTKSEMQPGEVLTWIMFVFTVVLALSVVAYYKFCKKNPYAHHYQRPLIAKGSSS